MYEMKVYPRYGDHNRSVSFSDVYETPERDMKISKRYCMIEYSEGCYTFTCNTFGTCTVPNAMKYIKMSGVTSHSSEKITIVIE